MTIEKKNIEYVELEPGNGFYMHIEDIGWVEFTLNEGMAIPCNVRNDGVDPKERMLGTLIRELPAPILHGVLSCLLYTSPSPRDRTRSRMPSSA